MMQFQQIATVLRTFVNDSIEFINFGFKCMVTIKYPIFPGMNKVNVLMLRHFEQPNVKIMD